MMIRGAASVALALSMAAVSTGVAARQACWTPAEIDAARVRDLQTYLMVGSLSCNDNPWLLRDYNRFVADHRQLIGHQNTVLKAHFEREAGVRGGAAAYDQFTTAMANNHSANGGDSPRSYCRSVEATMDDAVNARGDELDLVATELSERPQGIGETCDVDPARGRLTVARVDDEDAPRPVLTDTPVEPVSAPAAPPAARVIPASVSSQDAALQAAALAVQSAAAALQAAAEALPRNREPLVRASASADAPLPKDIHAVEPAPIVPPADEDDGADPAQ